MAGSERGSGGAVYHLVAVPAQTGWHAQLIRGSRCRVWADGDTRAAAIANVRAQVVAWKRTDPNRKAALECLDAASEKSLGEETQECFGYE